MKKIDKAVVAKAMTYSNYRQMIDELFAQNKTTGDNQSEAMLQYTKLNISRMKRLDKTARLAEKTLEQLSEIRQPITLLVLTEAWCGDAAQSIPVINKMAEASDQIELRLLLRGQHLDIMDAFLTNGGRSIPKVIVLDSESRAVLGSWGPRPAALQTIVKDGREAMKPLTDPAEKKAFYQELSATTQKWYARDKTRSIQREVMTTIEAAISVEAS